MKAVLLLGLLAFAAPQDKVAEDVIQLKDGKLVVGKITAVTEKSIDMTLRDGKTRSVALGEVHPTSVYKVRAARIDAKNAAAHWELGDYCKSNGLYTFAGEEYDKAAAIDAAYKDRAQKAREELRGEDARSKFEQAKRFAAEKKFVEANELLTLIVQKYGETPYGDEARRELEKLAADQRKENEARKAELEDKKRRKEEEAAKAAENAEKNELKRAQELMAEARTAWEEGLDWEAKANITKADKAWKQSDARLATARGLCEKLEKSNDVGMIKSAKDLEKELDGWIVRTCYRLGRLWATELNYGEAIVWLNKGIRLDPDNHLLNDVLLTLTQLKMRKNAAGGGY